MIVEKKEDDNNPDIEIKTSVKFIIYNELFFLFLFCCSNNYIIRDKKLEIIEKFEIPEKGLAWFGVVLQFGRVFGTFLIIAYVLICKTFKKMKYYTCASIFIKSFVFLIYCIDLFKGWTFCAMVIVSILIQGLCHSLIELFFHVWINHFLFWNLFSLSISIGASPLSNIIGAYFLKNDSISCCSIKLFIFILVLDLIFCVTAYYYDCYHDDKYFNLSYSKVKEDKKEENYVCNKDRNDKFIKKMNYEYLKSKFSEKYDFFSIALSRAILKFSFFGIYALLKKYYYKLDGDEELNEFLIYFLPSIGLFIGAGLSFFNWFKKNETILIISFLIGIFGTLACINNKKCFIISIFIFYVLANLIIPSLIQKSFDCFEDEQLHEISYAFNYFIYLVIGNLLPSILNLNIECTNSLMKFYLLIVWANVFLILIYICKNKKEKKNSDTKERMLDHSNSEVELEEYS